LKKSSAVIGQGFGERMIFNFTLKYENCNLNKLIVGRA
jgi:hypothetical protein